MKGDFTRSTFRPDKHYTSVRMQQGRIQLDADWNEQIDIQAYQQKSAAESFIGANGAPRTGAGFAIASGSELDFTVSPGRFFVGGLLCELPAGTTYLTQTDYPGAPSLTALGNGDYLAYLDVWTRHVTVLEDRELREVALNGPDTTTRSQTVWQVKLLKLASPIADGATADFASLLPPASLQMAATAQSDPGAPSGSLLPPGSGYQRLDNLLYRVEIHAGGQVGQDAVTFKWSRQNGSVVASWIAQQGNALTIGYDGRDAELGFSIGDYVELTDDTLELDGKPGVIVPIIAVEGAVLTIDPGTHSIDLASFPRNPKVRRWDMSTGALPVTTTGWLPLESGVQVRFTGATCRTGDYWLIPARTATRDVQWPQDGGQAAYLGPQGVSHGYAALAQFHFDGTTVSNLADLRFLFPSMVDLNTVSPEQFRALLQNHTHTGGTDGTQVPRGGIANAAIDGTKIDTGATVSVATLTTSGLLSAASASVSGATALGGNTTVGGTLGVSGAATLSSATVSGTLSLPNSTSNASIGGSLGVSGATTLSGNTTVGGTLGVSGAATLSSATVSGTLSLPSSTSNASIGGSLGVSGATTLSGNTTVGGLLGVSGAATLSSATVSGTLSLPNSTSNASIGGTLGVTGATTLSGNTTVGGTLGVSGAATLSSATVSGTLSLPNSTSNASIGGSLGVSGATTLSGNTTVGGTLGVSGAATLSSATVSGTLSLPNSTSNASIGGSLGVSGATALGGNTTVGGTLGVSGAATLSSATVSGTLSLPSSTSNASIGGTLGVSGATTLSGNTTVGGTLGVSGGATLSSATVSGTLSLPNSTSNASIGGTLGVSGATTLASTLTVSGAVTVSSNPLSVTGTDIYLNNSTARGTRTGTRSALSHASASGTSDLLVVNSSGAYTGGTRLDGQTLVSGPLYTQSNNVYLRAPGDTNNGLSLVSTSAPFNGSTVTGPALYGNAGGVLGTTSCPVPRVRGSLVLSGGYVTLPSRTDTFTGGFTIEAWVRFGAYNLNSRIIELGSGSASNNIILCNYGTNNDLQFQVYSGSTQAFQITAVGVLNTSSWIHLAVTIDTASPANVYVYVNGAQSTSTTTSGTRTLPPSVQRTSNYLGKSNTSSDGAFSGRVAQVALWGRALSGDEINDRYTNYRQVPTNSLLGLWPMDDVTGTTANDRSGYGANGTLSATGAAFESYMASALLWDSSNNVVVGNMYVTGTTTLYGSATARGTLAVTGTSTLTGNVSAGGTLSVTGASTLTGNVSAGGTLSVTGTSTLTGNVSAGGTLTVAGASILTGNATAGGTLTVTGASTLTGNVTAGGTLTVVGASTLTGNATAGGTLTVAGASTLTGNVTAGGTVTVAGATTLNSTLSVTGTDIYLTNTTARGTRTGTRSALTHASTSSTSDLLVINSSGAYTGGTRLDGQTLVSGPLYAQSNNVYLSSPGDANNGLSLVSSSAPFNGSTVTGPALYGNAGGVLGTTSCPAARVRGSVSLSNSYVTLPARTDSFTGGFTFEAWVYYPSTPLSFSRVFDFGSGAPADNILLTNSSATDMMFHSYSANALALQVNAAGVLTVGAWFHVAITIDASNNVKFYKNGQAVTATVTLATGYSALPKSTTRTICYFGRSNWASDLPFTGKIAQAALWGRALSADEINDRYTDYRQVPTTSLLSYWPLDEATGTTANDRTGNGANGTLASAGATFESYMASALTWDRSNNVTVGNNLTVTGKLKSGNYRYSGSPTIDSAVLVANATTAWTALDSANLSGSFTTSGDSYVLIILSMGDVRVTYTTGTGSYTTVYLRLLVDNAVVATAAIVNATNNTVIPVTLNWCGRLTTTSHTFALQAQVVSNTYGSVTVGNYGQTRNLSIIEL